MTEKLETLISSLPGWCSIKKANTLHELVKRCDAKVVVEIGTFGGRAAIALASACKETGGKYYGIDPYDYQASLEGNVNKDHDEYWTSMDFDTVYDQMILGLTEAGLMDCVELVKKRSQDAFGQFKDIDVLYIDGNPSPEVTMEDVNNYAPLVKAEGYLVFNNSDWGTKPKAKRKILEHGFVEFLKEVDSDKCEWTVYQKTDTKSTLVSKDAVATDPLEEKVMSLPGWGTAKQCKALYNLVIESKAKVSVDIGVFGGRFLYAMAMAHKSNGEGKCFGIDPWEGAPCTEGTNDKENDDWWTDPDKVDFKKLHKDVVELMISEDLTDYSNIIRFKSSEAFALFTQIDICSIDGNHSEEISCQDVATYAPLVRPGGYIHFDDANWPTTQKAQELILNYGFEEILFIEEGDGRDWKIYRKLSEDGEKVDVSKILAESKNKVEEKLTVTVINPKPMNDTAPIEDTLIKEEGKSFPIYDPSLKPPCAEIPITPFDIALRGGMQIGPLKVQPMLLYIPDDPSGNKYWIDRWKRGMAHFEEVGIKNIIEVAGIHGQSFGILGNHTYDKDNPGTGYNIGPGYTAQFLSVYLLYSIANVLPFDHFLFLECDAEFIPDALHHLAKELENVPADFDWLWVGSCCNEGKTTRHVKGNVYEFTPRTGYPFCGHAYLVARKALPFIIQTQRDCYASSDLSLVFHTFPHLKTYGIFPRLATQYNNDLPI